MLRFAEWDATAVPKRLLLLSSVATWGRTETLPGCGALSEDDHAVRRPLHGCDDLLALEQQVCVCVCVLPCYCCAAARSSRAIETMER